MVKWLQVTRHTPPGIKRSWQSAVPCTLNLPQLGSYTGTAFPPTQRTNSPRNVSGISAVWRFKWSQVPSEGTRPARLARGRQGLKPGPQTVAPGGALANCATRQVCRWFKPNFLSRLQSSTDKNIDLNLDLFVVVKPIKDVVRICREISWISKSKCSDWYYIEI